MFHEGKHNIERMNERIVDSSYDSLHHFISDSPWDHRLVLSAVRQDISKLFEERSGSIGLLIDESGHPKRGNDSVGVARQYLGSVGKIDNGQVGVFAALAQNTEVAMVNARLYLPQAWSKDKRRCAKVGVPKEEQKHLTKPQIALKMIKEMEGEIQYDWVGGDCIYGASPVLRKGIEEVGKSYVLDIREHKSVYLQDPCPYIPKRKSEVGRKNSSWVTDHKSVKLQEIYNSLQEQDWAEYCFRQGTKGPLKRRCHCREVFIWAKRRPTTEKAQKLRLIISENLDGSEIKYSLFYQGENEKKKNISNKTLLYRQMHRYWVERAIQDCKDSLGMTEYQVRKWRAW
ncbi:MAG: IS701 family transposase, partial [Bacteroidota bacterium]